MRNALMIGASVLAISAVTPALAFNQLDWDWELEKDTTFTETFTIDVEVEFDANIEGMAVIEKLQFLSGDVTAVSNVDTLTFTPFGTPENGDQQEVMIDETFTVSLSYFDEATDEFANGDVSGFTDLSASLVPGSGQINDLGLTTPGEGPEIELTADFNLTGTIDIGFQELALDVEEDLAYVEAAATAIGNNQSVSSPTAMMLHDAQFVVGDLSFGNADTGGVADDDSSLGEVAGSVFGAAYGEGDGQIDNPSLTGALALILGAAGGVVDQASISATTNVFDISQAQVNAPALAVANNMSIEQALGDDAAGVDGWIQADLTQVAFADVSATSNVTDISIEGFTNMGLLRPDELGAAVNGAATAIGNNMAVTVELPEINGSPGGD